MSRYIKELIAQGEGLHLDFKFEIADAKKIARTFSAFANTLGGKLLIGVKDNGKITGIRSEEEEYMAENCAQLYCRPEVEFELRPWVIDKKTILEISIPESPNKPHLSPWKDGTWKAFIRSADENFIAHTVLYEVWKIQQQKKSIEVRYDREEELLFNYLHSHPSISIEEFRALAKINNNKAKRILSNLISIQLLEPIISAESTLFTLRSP